MSKFPLGFACSLLLILAQMTPLAAREPRTQAGRCAKNAGAPYDPTTGKWWPPSDRNSYNQCINAAGLAETRSVRH